MGYVKLKPTRGKAEMGFWRHIVIEGYCVGQTGVHPCGKLVSDFCLANGHCPHFLYASSNEREAGFFVPLVLILSDRLSAQLHDFLGTLKWHLWERWRYYSDDWPNNTAFVECPEWENYLTDASNKFEEWLREAELAC